MTPWDLSIRRPVATTMFFLIIITVGAVGFMNLPIDLLPSIQYERISLHASYGNVGPAEMEELVTEPLENAVSGVSNLENMQSNSSEGSSWVSMEFTRGTDLAEATNEVREAIDEVMNSLPDEVDRPRIRKFDPDDTAIVDMGVSSSTHNLDVLTEIVDRDLVRRFQNIDGVGSIETGGGIQREIHVNLDRNRLTATGVTIREVQEAIQRESAIAPGGTVKDGLEDLQVRTMGEYETIDEVREAVVMNIDGTPLRVRDIANVEWEQQGSGEFVEVDDRPVIQMEVRKQSGANTVSVARAIRTEAEQINSSRDDINVIITSDQSYFIQQSIGNVQRAALWGAFLAIIVLYFFLRNGSSTGIVSLSIPISLITTFGLLYFANLSLNLMTFGGLALGIGLIVDNSIVVLENIVRQREENRRSLSRASSEGTREVAGAIIASTITTSVIFLPILFMETITAVLFLELALVVVFALLCSLLVALTLVPMFSSQFLTIPVGPDPEDTSASGTNTTESEMEDGDIESDTEEGHLTNPLRGIEYMYAGFVEWALDHRFLIVITSALLVGGAVYLSSYLDIELAPETDANSVEIDLRMDDGVNLAVSRNYLQQLDNMVKEVVDDDEVRHIATETAWGRGEIEIAMPNPDERTTTSHELADRIRDHVQGKIPGGEVSVEAEPGLWMLRRVFSGGRGGGTEAIQMELYGYDQDESLRIAEDMRDRIEAIPGIHDVIVGDEDEVGQPEQQLRLNRDRIADLGLSVQQVSDAVSVGLGGGEAGHIREDGNEYPIQVQLRPEDRLTAIDLENLTIRTPNDDLVPIASVTNQVRARGPTSISRVNGRRVRNIRANLESGLTLGNAVERIRSELRGMNMPEDFSYAFTGEYEEQIRAQQDFQLAIIMALALIYMVMAGQFERFLDPILIMCSVPLALVGVVPTLYLTGTTFNIQSLMGLIMLIGIVVNNAIVLVDYINLMQREHGLELKESIVEAGRLRLRPILITTVTTVLAMVPLAVGAGAGAEIQAALALTVIGGLTASTAITLLLIPVIYYWTHSIKQYLLGS